MSLSVTWIGLLACMLVGEYFLEMVESALKFPFYASGVYILLSYVCMLVVTHRFSYSDGVILMCVLVLM